VSGKRATIHALQWFRDFAAHRLTSELVGVFGSACNKPAESSIRQRLLGIAAPCSFDRAINNECAKVVDSTQGAL
jgi:hypothetical protein